jgi:hypothetical protein
MDQEAQLNLLLLVEPAAVADAGVAEPGSGAEAPAAEGDDTGG